MNLTIKRDTGEHFETRPNSVTAMRERERLQLWSAKKYAATEKQILEGIICFIRQ